MQCKGASVPYLPGSSCSILSYRTAQLHRSVCTSLAPNVDDDYPSKAVTSGLVKTPSSQSEKRYSAYSVNTFIDSFPNSPGCIVVDALYRRYTPQKPGCWGCKKQALTLGQFVKWHSHRVTDASSRSTDMSDRQVQTGHQGTGRMQSECVVCSEAMLISHAM